MIQRIANARGCAFDMTSAVAAIDRYWAYDSLFAHANAPDQKYVDHSTQDADMRQLVVHFT